MSSGFLHRYFLNNGHKQLHKWLHYFDIYERHFERFRDRPITMLEIGVSGGGSLEMWKAYFHPDSIIVGIDIDPRCKALESPGIEIHIGSQDDADFLAGVAEQYGRFDIVLDDGSHVSPHVVKTFETLYPITAPRGVFMIEDMHASYWPNFSGGFRAPGAFIEYAKDKIDELNAVHVKEYYPVTDFTKSTDGIAFYDSVVVFEKCPQGRRQAVITKAMTDSKRRSG